MVNIMGVEIAHWNSATYFPSEDSCLLIDALVEGRGSFIDAGTGTGIVGIRAAMLGYSVISTDISRECLLVATQNALLNRVSIQTVRCNLLSAVAGIHDVIAFNAPYLPDDGSPDRQLTGGVNGYEIASELLSQAEDLLGDNGMVILVLSSLGGMDEFVLKYSTKWSFRKLKQRKLEFETIAVFEARLRKQAHPSQP
jgi:release factor glutamine methyltransferase